MLNPLFLIFLAVLILRALISPLGSISEIAPSGAYQSEAFFTGLLEGYNTMDALAGLAFGIIVVHAVRRLGVEKPEEVAKNTVLAGIFSSLLMALIYALVTMVGAQSRGLFDVASNGGEALAQIAEHYFGSAGAAILAVTVTVACLKTAVGTDHQLRGNLCEAVSRRSFLQGLGHRLLCPVLSDRQSGTGLHHRLFHAGADVPLSSGHRTDSSDPLRQIF